MTSLHIWNWWQQSSSLNSFGMVKGSLSWVSLTFGVSPHQVVSGNAWRMIRRRSCPVWNPNALSPGIHLLSLRSNLWHIRATALASTFVACVNESTLGLFITSVVAIFSASVLFLKTSQSTNWNILSKNATTVVFPSVINVVKFPLSLSRKRIMIASASLDPTDVTRTKLRTIPVRHILPESLCMMNSIFEHVLIATNYLQSIEYSVSGDRCVAYEQKAEQMMELNIYLSSRRKKIL